MKLKVRYHASATRATLWPDGDPETIITVRASNARAIGQQIVRAVNRDKLFDALVTALTPFGSTEMGNLLLEAILAMHIDVPNAEVEKRLHTLIKAVDIVLKAVELEKARP